MDFRQESGHKKMKAIRVYALPHFVWLALKSESARSVHITFKAKG